MKRDKSLFNKLRSKFLIEKDYKIKGFPLITTLLLCGLTFLIAYFIFKPKSQKSSSFNIDDISDKFVYKTSVVELIDRNGKSDFAGKISFDENRIVKVFSIVSGKVEDIKVSVGSYVKKGDVLAKIKSTDISEYRKEYKVARANFEIARKKLKVAEDLYKSKFNSEVEVINARKEFEKANDELRKSEEVLKIYGADPGKNFPYYILKAPIEGFIVEKNINNNTLIRPDNGSSIFTISDLKTVWVYANVFEDDISSIKEGQEATVKTLVFPDMPLKGIINNVSHVVNANSKALRIRVELENPDGKLRPEMTAKVNVLLSTNKSLAIPAEALIFDKNKYFVIKPISKKFTIVPVELVEKNVDHSFIKGNIQAGDTVITQGSLLLYNQIANRL